MNWQAYLDGSMDTGERILADAKLERDPEARAELEALRTFIEMVRTSGHEMPVNQIKLHQVLSRVKHKNPSRWTALAAATVAVTALAFAIPSAISFVRGSQPQSWVNPNESIPPESARASFSHSTHVIRGLLEKGVDGAKLTSVHEGATDAGYEFSLGGNAYHLLVNLTPDSNGPCGEAGEKLNGIQLYEHSGVSWRENGVTYALKGGTQEGRRSFVKSLVPAMNSHFLAIPKRRL